MLAIDETLSGALSLAKDAELLRSLARERGMLPMSADGMMKAAKGLTTLDELMRVTYA
jgi:type II secretory ATPase GspE/PulE/Tfp pilus assembly ATPase PilB-like protein